MRSTLFCLFALLLAACPTTEPEVETDQLWDPQLQAGRSGPYDLGALAVGDAIAEAINLTNNTDSDMVVSIEFDLDPNEGFWGSGLDATQEATLEAGADLDINFKLNATAPGDISSTINFVFESRVVHWTIIGTVN